MLCLFNIKYLLIWLMFLNLFCFVFLVYKHIYCTWPKLISQDKYWFLFCVVVCFFCCDRWFGFLFCFWLLCSHYYWPARLCLSTWGRPHVASVCSTVVCKSLFIIIITIIMFYIWVWFWLWGFNSSVFCFCFNLFIKTINVL